MTRFASIFLLCAISLACACLGTSKKYDLVWPHPQSIIQHDQYHLIHVGEFSIQTDSKCDLIQEAIKRYNERMFVQDCGNLDPRYKGIFFIPRRINRDMDPNNKGVLKNLTVNFKGDCEKLPQMNMVEKYHLLVDESKAEIVGDSVWAALRALETFSQLLVNTGRDEFLVNLVKIEDWPRFAHRGLLVDSSRHFLSMNSIYQTLDAMEMNKLNVFHWHIVDDQAFPFVSETFPQLSELGSYDPNHLVYRKKDVEDILEYARLRGIRVLVEFDTPGHTISWGKAEKDLLTPCYKDGKPDGEMGPIDPTVESTYTFIRKLFSEIARRFPDEYLHLGGDEVSFDCWRSNPKINDFMAKHKMSTDYSKLESYYIQKLLDIIKDLNKSYIVWQEVFDNNATLKRDTVVHVWINEDYLPWKQEISKVVKAGYNALLSAPWYLDWISWSQDWIKYYETEPLNFNATDAEKKLVLGGEAAMWGEFADGSNVIAKTWPRASAVAERLWSDAQVNVAEKARPRFHEMHCRLQRQGLRPGPIDGPGHCQCDYVL